MGHGHYIDPFAQLCPAQGADAFPSGKRISQTPGADSLRGPAYYRVPAGETLDLHFVILPGESRDIDWNIDLCGPGAEAHIKGLFLCNEAEKVRIRIVMHHREPGCRSTQLIKGIAGGRADVHFDGIIVVAPDAQQTEAYQENHNIVLTDEARVETKPQLEIYADDVKCSHGATIGRLSEDELFYMRSRGIPEADARALQMLSFLTPVIPSGREEELGEAILKTLAHSTRKEVK